MGDRALPYRILEHGHTTTVDLLCSARPHSAHTEVQVAVIEHCLTDERCWTVAELFAHSGISSLTLFHILWKDLKIHKLDAKWVPHALGEAQKIDSIRDMLYQSGVIPT